MLGEEATEAFARLVRPQVKADPRNGRAWHSLGLMMQRAGDFEAAEQCFREGVRQARAGPHKAKCYDKLAMEMSVRGDVHEARQLFSDGCAAAPGSAYHLRQWALFEKKNGTAEDARRLFEQAAAAQPSASRTWLQVRPCDMRSPCKAQAGSALVGVARRVRWAVA